MVFVPLCVCVCFVGGGVSTSWRLGLHCRQREISGVTLQMSEGEVRGCVCVCDIYFLFHNQPLQY